VCHCSTVLPVFKFNGNFLLQDSDNGSQWSGKSFAFPSVVLHLNPCV
jgi:hypothetical protein